VVSEKIACKYDLNDYINGLEDGQIGTLIVAVDLKIRIAGYWLKEARLWTLAIF